MSEGSLADDCAGDGEVLGARGREVSGRRRREVGV
jgi:hypothetical protein